MTNTGNNLDPTIAEQEAILEKQEILKEAMGLSPTTEEEMLEIARKILETSNTNNLEEKDDKEK